MIEAPNTTLFVPPDWQRADRRAPDLLADAEGRLEEGRGPAGAGATREEGWQAMSPKTKAIARRRRVRRRVGPRPRRARELRGRRGRNPEEQLERNDRLLRETGHLFGLEKLRRKEADPGTYEAVWQILLNICNTGQMVGCKVSSSPIAAEGGDALWSAAPSDRRGDLHLARNHVAPGPAVAAAALVHRARATRRTPASAPGDIFENNDPHFGGIHSADFDTAIPIFYRGELIAWTGSVTPRRRTRASSSRARSAS